MLAEKILKTIQNKKIEVIDNKNITISIGIAEFNLNKDYDKTSKEKIFKNFFIRSDKALYKAKNNGRNQYQISE